MGGLVHLFAGCGEHVVQLGHGAVDTGHVLRTVGGLEFAQGLLDRLLLVRWDLLTEFLQLFFRLEDQAIGLVQLVHTLAGCFVGIGIGFGLLFHLFDVVLAQAAARLDPDVLLLAGSLVLGAHVQDAVRVYVEGHFDLGHAAWCWRDTVQVEATDRAVTRSHGAFALQYVDLDAGLAVAGRAEGLALFGRDRGVRFDQLGHHPTHGLDAEAQRGHVEKEDVLHLPGKHATLDRSAHGHHLIRVHALARLLAEELLHRFLNGRDACAATHQDDLVDVRGLQACVLQGAFARGDGALDQAVRQLFEFCAAEATHQVFRHAVDGHDVGQVDLAARGGAQFDLGLLGSVLQTLERHRILTEVQSLVVLELIGQPVDDHLIEVVTTQVRVTVGAFHFEHAVA